jgi:hypothetical protein
MCGQGAFLTQATLNNVEVIFGERSQGGPGLCGYLAGMPEHKFSAAYKLYFARPVYQVS